MLHLIFDSIAWFVCIAAVTLLISYLILNIALRRRSIRALRNTMANQPLCFTHQTPRLLHLWLQRNEQQQWQLMAKLFFVFETQDSKKTGLLIMHKHDIVNLTWYPDVYDDPEGRLPMVCANDNINTRDNVITLFKSKQKHS